MRGGEHTDDGAGKARIAAAGDEGGDPEAEEIRCRPDRGCEGACRESFDTVYAGFALLAGEYPEHVSAREI